MVDKCDLAGEARHLRCRCKRHDRRRVEVSALLRGENSGFPTTWSTRSRSMLTCRRSASPSSAPRALAQARCAVWMVCRAERPSGVSRTSLARRWAGLLVDGQAVAYQEVGQSLHALAGEVQCPRDLGDRRGRVLDHLENQPLPSPAPPPSEGKASVKPYTRLTAPKHENPTVGTYR